VKAPVTIDLDDIPWQPHPTIPGIDVRAFQNEADFSPTDILIARVAAGGEIPWHVHDSETEIAYVLQGTGRLYSAESEARDPAAESPMLSGQAVIIPPGLWHCVHNTGAEELIILALHTP
jgi:mannose-6-phosphate isomerase-like protein (cupin superfamily)